MIEQEGKALRSVRSLINEISEISEISEVSEISEISDVSHRGKGVGQNRRKIRRISGRKTPSRSCETLAIGPFGDTA